MSEAETIANLAVNAAAPTLVTTALGRQFLIAPDQSPRDVTEPNAVATIKPDYIHQGVTLQTVDSLVDYLNRFKTDDTVLFADIAANTIVGAVDYHAPNAAALLGHKATLTLPFAIEWKTWAEIDGKLMAQLEFARFLEESAGDVVAPSGAELLDACRDLQARRKVNFTKAVRTNSDNESFEYTDETTANIKKGGVEIPSKFQLQIPVYFGGATTDLFAFLRWRLEEGEGLKLGVKLHRAEHVRQAVFKQIVLDAAGRTERPAVFGKLT